jgi:hypothetical protein
LPPGEAAAELHVEPQTQAAWRYRNQGPAYVKIGKLIFYRPSDLREYVRRRVVQPTGARS